jgi:hypothetical protein
MAKKTGKCGNATVEYDEECSYGCLCIPQGCRWTVVCPKPGGGTYTTKGSGRMANDGGTGGHAKPKLTVAGPADGIAFALEKIWKRPIGVPETMRGKKIRKRTVTGTPEEMVRALGLRLKPR